MTKSQETKELRNLIREYIEEYYPQVIKPTITDRDVQIYGGAGGEDYGYGYADYGYDDYDDDGDDGGMDEADSCVEEQD